MRTHGHLTIAWRFYRTALLFLYPECRGEPERLGSSLPTVIYAREHYRIINLRKRSDANMPNATGHPRMTYPPSLTFTQSTSTPLGLGVCTMVTAAAQASDPTVLPSTQEHQSACASRWDAAPHRAHTGMVAIGVKASSKRGRTSQSAEQCAGQDGC